LRFLSCTIHPNPLPDGYAPHLATRNAQPAPRNAG
jgi:hypothetical protein